jgi:predicted RNA-binding Zn-ribbon protein involved in translation (DUF1610 family)
MLGYFSIGFLLRNPGNIDFICGDCGHKSSLQPVELPAALSLLEAAKCHRCPMCGHTSSGSRLEDRAETPKGEGGPKES